MQNVKYCNRQWCLFKSGTTEQLRTDTSLKKHSLLILGDMKRKVFKVSRTVLANSNSQTFIPIDFSDRCLAINSRTKPDDSTKWPQLSLSGKRCVQFGLLRYSSRPRLIPPTLTARGGHHSKLHVLEWCPLTVLESHICPGHRKHYGMFSIHHAQPTSGIKASQHLDHPTFDWIAGRRRPHVHECQQHKLYKTSTFFKRRRWIHGQWTAGTSPKTPTIESYRKNIQVHSPFR